MTVGSLGVVLRGAGLAPARPRALLAGAGLALGVSVVAALAIITQTASSAFRVAVEEDTGRADVRITGGQAGFPEAVLDAVRACPQVAVASPLVRGGVFTDDPVGEPLEVFGIDLADEEARALHRGAAALDRGLATDPLALLNQPEAVMVAPQLARQRRLEIGSALSVMTPGGARRLVVQGFVPAGGAAELYGGRVVVMDLYAAQLVLGRGSSIDAIDVLLRPGADLRGALEALRALLPAGLTAERPEERGAHVDRMVVAFRALIEAAGCCALLLALFLAYGAAATELGARRRALAIVRALGAPRRCVLALVGVRTLMVGAAGGVAGLALGIVLARWLERPVLQAFNMQFVAAVRADEAAARATPLALAPLLGVAAAFVGASVPAWTAARVPVVDGLRRADAPWRPTAVPRSAVLGAALIAGALFALGRAGGAVADAGASMQGIGLDRGVALGLLLGGGVLETGVALRAGTRLARLVAARLGGTALVAGTVGLGVRDRTVVAVGALALGVALSLDVATIHASVERSVAELLARQLRGDLVVSSVHVAGGWVPAPLAGTLAAELAAFPGVRRVTSMRTVEQPYDGDTVRVRAIGGGLDDGALAASLLVAGDPAAALAALRAGRGVVISRNLARRHRLGVGDVMRLTTPRGTRALPVVGVVTDLSSERGTVTLDRALYRRWWADDLVNVLELALVPGADARAVADALARRFGRAHHLQIRTVAAHRRARLASVRRAFAFVPAVEALGLVVTALALADNLLASVSERRRELATLRALGATRAAVALLVGGEALFLGLTGGVVGVGVGSLVAWAWLRLALPDLIGFGVDFHFPAARALASGLAAVLVAALAALAPAVRAAALAPARALRCE